MELVPPVSFRDHEAGRLELVEVLGDRLPCRAEPMLHHHPRADFEQCLAVSFAELIEDRPPCGVSEGSVDISQRPNDMQVTTCLSSRSRAFVLGSREVHPAYSRTERANLRSRTVSTACCVARD